MGCGASTQARPADADDRPVNPTGISSEDRPDAKKASEDRPAAEKAGALGIIRLDYNYPAAPGDIDHPASYAYDVFYKVVPGFTFEMCMSGKMTPEVEESFKAAIKYFEEKGVSGITGDCGFMMYFQQLARQVTYKPVFMSALAQLPAVTSAFSKDELIAVFTANGKSLDPMRDLIRDECGVDTQQQRLWSWVARTCPISRRWLWARRSMWKRWTPGIVAKARDVMTKHPNIRAILLECTELPAYADALRKETGLPVYDAITGCDFFMTGVQDNERFGIQDWQVQWDGKQEEYTFAKNLSEEEKAKLVNMPQEERSSWLASIGKPYVAAADVLSQGASATTWVKDKARLRLACGQHPCGRRLEHSASSASTTITRQLQATLITPQAMHMTSSTRSCPGSRSRCA